MNLWTDSVDEARDDFQQRVTESVRRSLEPPCLDAVCSAIEQAARAQAADELSPAAVVARSADPAKSIGADGAHRWRLPGIWLALLIFAVLGMGSFVASDRLARVAPVGAVVRAWRGTDLATAVAFGVTGAVTLAATARWLRRSAGQVGSPDGQGVHALAGAR